MSARTMKKGFTLVEILIVVVILGILAAIVIPQFTKASEAAKGSSLVSQLQTIRSQLELYQIQHNGDYPTLANFWDQLTETTDLDGTVQTDGSGDYGPYLPREIENPFTNSFALDATTASADEGWIYNQTTGEITASIDINDADAAGLDYAADNGNLTTFGSLP